MLIYKTTNLINGKIYIGQELRFNPKYLGSGTMLRRAIKKYGVVNFKKDILEDGIISKQLLDQREIFWIKEFKSQSQDIGYNITHGGQGGNFLPPELMEKKGRTISKVKSGKHLSEDHKQKIKDTFNKRYPPKEKDTTNHFFGKKHTGDMNRFKTRTGTKPDNAIKIKDECGIQYDSIRDASKQFPNPDVARRAISDVCKGKRLDYKGKKFYFKN